MTRSYTYYIAKKGVALENFGKEGIVFRLEQIDEDLLAKVGGGKRFEITIVGGSALLLLNLAGDVRVTTDIDVMEATQQVEAFLGRYDMNQNVSTFRYRLPENWAERRQKVPFEGLVLDVYAPSNEDLAILKLDAYREVDRQDLEKMVTSGNIDFKKLEAIVHDKTELQANYSGEEWEIFLLRLEKLKLFKHLKKDRHEATEL